MNKEVKEDSSIFRWLYFTEAGLSMTAESGQRNQMSQIALWVSPSALIQMFGAERSVYEGKREKESSISSHALCLAGRCSRSIRVLMHFRLHWISHAELSCSRWRTAIVISSSEKLCRSDIG